MVGWGTLEPQLLTCGEAPPHQTHMVWPQVYTGVWGKPAPLSPPHRFMGLSVSSSFRMDFPSISEGMSSPAMSRMVGARSMLRTMWGFLGEAGRLSLRRGAAGGVEVARDWGPAGRKLGPCYSLNLSP